MSGADPIGVNGVQPGSITPLNARPPLATSSVVSNPHRIGVNPNSSRTSPLVAATATPAIAGTRISADGKIRKASINLPRATAATAKKTDSVGFMTLLGELWNDLVKYVKEKICVGILNDKIKKPSPLTENERTKLNDFLAKHLNPEYLLNSLDSIIIAIDRLYLEVTPNPILKIIAAELCYSASLTLPEAPLRRLKFYLEPLKGVRPTPELIALLAKMEREKIPNLEDRAALDQIREQVVLKLIAEKRFPQFTPEEKRLLDKYIVESDSIDAFIEHADVKDVQHPEVLAMMHDRGRE